MRAPCPQFAHGIALALANANRSHYSSSMVICLCHRVSDRDIVRAARAGCSDFEALQQDLRVGTSCGACLDCARDEFDAHAGRCAEPACGQPHASVQATA